MKLDRPFYSLAEVQKMAADALAPIPRGKLTKFRLRENWFPPDALDGDFAPSDSTTTRDGSPVA